ncbi:MAG: sigma factor-like helix-turn-helix DNA-binding protein [Nitrosotalea sp.]
MNDDKQQQIIEKLDLMIKLLAVGVIRGKEVREQILTLSRMGISNKDIALILGKTQNTVNATLSQARRETRNE